MKDFGKISIEVSMSMIPIGIMISLILSCMVESTYKRTLIAFVRVVTNYSESVKTWCACRLVLHIINFGL